MIDFIDRNDGRPDELIAAREHPSLTTSKSVWAGTVRVDDLHWVLDDVAFAARAVAVADTVSLSIRLTRPIWDPSREQVALGIASLTGDGALTSARTA